LYKIKLLIYKYARTHMMLYMYHVPTPRRRLRVAGCTSGARACIGGDELAVAL